MASTYATSSESNYEGYLIRVNNSSSGNYKIPTEYIQANSYKVTRNIQDLDSYRDANGELHRNALDHVPIKVECTTVPMLDQDEWASIINNISKRWSIPKERKASMTVYVPETNEYVTQAMYMSDIEVSMYYADSNKKIQYNAIGLTWIGY